MILSCQKNYAVVATLSSFLVLLFSATPPGKTLKRQKLHGEEIPIRIRIRSNEPSALPHLLAREGGGRLNFPFQ